MGISANIYTIPIEKSFVDVLAHEVLAEFGSAPEQLSRITILLPNRRSCRALRDAFLRAHGKPLLLPRLRPIGDIEEDELLFTAGAENAEIAEMLASLPLPMPPTLRLVMLADMLWREHHPMRIAEARLPFSASQALTLAQELLRFIDEIAREDLPYTNLAQLVPEEYARHWQVTLDFLNSLFTEWPEKSARRGYMEPVERRNRIIQAQTAHWPKKTRVHTR